MYNVDVERNREFPKKKNGGFIMKKRIISALLCIATILSMVGIFGTSAFAYDYYESENNDTIIIIAGVSAVALVITATVLYFVKKKSTIRG